MKPETYTELGKACLNIAVGLFLVGIVQPFLSGTGTWKILVLSGTGFLLFALLGSILLNRGRDNNGTDTH